MTTGNDKRMHPRMQMVLKVEYTNQESFLADYTNNASQGGLFIATTREFPIGEVLTFDISFPGLLQPIRCRAEVRWRRPPESATDELPAGIGVQFKTDSPDDPQRMRRLLEQISQPASGKNVATQAPGKPAEQAAAQMFRVLVVEDNPLVREMLRFAVRKFHQSRSSDQRQLEVHEAENGLNGWEKLQQNRYDMVIVDYYMPVMNGVQLVQKIRNDPDAKHVPVIVVSVGGDEARQEAYGAGADLYIDKPLVLNQLFESMQKLLGLGKLS